jgi:Mn-dependent DtxR family transcriptional regulator
MADELEVGVATTHSYLELLHEEGMIEWIPRQHRSIRCTQKGIQRLSQLVP